MTKEEVIENISPLIDKAIAVVETDDNDKIMGTIIRLNAKATKENDYRAFIEVTVIGLLLDEKVSK